MSSKTLQPDVTRFIVVGGNVIDGLQFYGPFVTHEEAVSFAEGYINSMDHWNVTEMHGPL